MRALYFLRQKIFLYPNLTTHFQYMRRSLTVLGRIFILFIFTFSFSSISAQEITYLNKYKVPIKDLNSYEPMYYNLTTNDRAKSVVQTFCMDSTLINEKHTLKTEGNQELVLYHADYYGHGSLRSLEELLDNKNVFFQEFHENGKVKSKILLRDDEVLEETYYDEEGKVRSKYEVEHPEPFGGLGGWNQYLGKNLKYPKAARKKGEEGIAYLYFTIDEEGKMQDIDITNPEWISTYLAEEALRVLSSYPYAWTPGRIDGKPVKVEMRLPLRFKL